MISTCRIPNSRGVKRLPSELLASIWQCQSRLMSTQVQRLSKLFSPTIRLDAIPADSHLLRSYSLLVHGGFLRQSSAGIFSILPNGLRVLQKLERIIDQEMHAIGASKLSLPSLLPAQHWQKTGRFTSMGNELFTLKDRKKSQYLLGPTFEEEITTLVHKEIVSWKNLPIKVYQSTRKFRDEPRPRSGILRGREFIMKDLYTFASTEEEALVLYAEVGQAYRRIFDRIGLPYVEAQAESGNIGGSRSHEFHYPASVGEDQLIHCKTCSYTANAELATSVIPAKHDTANLPIYEHAEGLAVICLPDSATVSDNKLRKLLPGARLVKGREITSNQPVHFYFDQSCGPLTKEMIAETISACKPDPDILPAYSSCDVVVAEAGHSCTQCGSVLESITAIEIGHTFHLGTTYSAPLNATVVPQVTLEKPEPTAVPLQMGCYGIGVTRLLGSIAELCADDKGIAWPPSVAPWSLAIIPLSQDLLDQSGILRAIGEAFDQDNVVLDDRYDMSFGKRMKDAELVGYNKIMVIGKTWEREGKVELLDRRTGKKEVFGRPQEALEALNMKSV